MISLGKVSLFTMFLLLLAGTAVTKAVAAEAAPDFRQVYDLIRQHLSGVDETNLNRTAVQALISALAPRVSLVDQASTEAPTETVLVSKTSLFDGPVGYIRVSRVEQGLDKAVKEAWQGLGSTNPLAGIVLDLRYAGGTDYSAAVATADLFIRKEQPLLDWGKGMARSKEKSDSISLPMAVLVNHQTAAAAEALAAALREASAGLILGSPTAGQAMIAQEYPLNEGKRLRIATTPIQLGDGSALSTEGIKPDIKVEVNPAEERAYYADAFKEISRPIATGGANPASGANRTRRPRFNEAELVRERKEGPVLDSDVSGTNAGDNEKPAVRDPVLARSLDFLKGLSVVRQTRF